MASEGGRAEPRRWPVLIGRALRRRCPNCGGEALFESWLRIRPRCPDCGLRANRGETDYFIGGYTVNLIVSELLVAAVGLIVILLSWPDVPWNAVLYGLVALMIPAPFLTYPFSKTVWLALDLLFRPLRPSDFAADAALGPDRGEHD